MSDKPTFRRVRGRNIIIRKPVFGDDVRKAREAHRLSQQDLANTIGVTVSTVTKWESQPHKVILQKHWKKVDDKHLGIKAQIMAKASKMNVEQLQKLIDYTSTLKKKK